MISVGDMTTRERPTELTGLAQAGKESVPDFDPAMHWHETLHDGSKVLIRPIRKDDGGPERAFIDHLSPESREYRFLGQVKVGDDLLRRMTDIDYERDMAENVAMRNLATSLGFDRKSEGGYPAEVIHTLVL